MEKNKEETLASSIGLIGKPYYDDWNNRVKGFCSTVIVREDREATEFIKESRELKSKFSATRITLRMIASKGLKMRGMQEEARIQLGGGWKGYEIIYLGENDPKRRSPSKVLISEDELLKRAICRGDSRRISDVFQRVGEKGYKVSVESVRNPKDVVQIYNVYQEAFSESQGTIRYTFKLTEENVRGVLSTATTCVARDSEGRIVSVVLGEIAIISTNIGTLKLCEYSDEATLRDYRKCGLGQACLHVLVRELSEKTDDIILIYGEARAPHAGANVVPARVGFSYGGRLIQHCTIGGDKEIKEVTGPYEDLNVWYLPRSQI